MQTEANHHTEKMQADLQQRLTAEAFVPALAQVSCQPTDTTGTGKHSNI